MPLRQLWHLLSKINDDEEEDDDTTYSVLIYDILELWLIQHYIKYEQFFFYMTVT